MAARYRDRINKLGAQLIGHLLELIGLELTEVLGKLDGIEERSTIADGHFNSTF